MTHRRKTVAAPVRFQGVGLHGGEPVVVLVHPSDEGIAFRSGSSTVVARPENVTDTTRSTKLGEVGTIEHLMGALAGLEITDALIEVQGPELPAMGGAADGYVQALEHAGYTDLGEANVRVPFKRVYYSEDGVKVAAGRGNGHWRYTFDVGDRWPGRLAYEHQNLPQGFAAEIAPARTFALAEEVPYIIQAGLAKGLDESSALILGIEGYKNDARFPEEPSRHKILDLMGDLYLSGIPVRFLNVSAEKSGHRHHVEAARRLRLHALAEDGAPHPVGRVVILSGPSGVGKDTVIEAWHESDPRVTRVVAFTTRSPRPGETEGIDYHFVSPERFHRMADAGDFLEYKEVHGNWYATPLRDLDTLLAEGKIAILKIDVQGAEEARKRRPDALSIFLLPPSWDELEGRIRRRGTESEEQIAKRLQNARRELAEADAYQHRIVNDDLDKTVEELHRLVG